MSEISKTPLMAEPGRFRFPVVNREQRSRFGYWMMVIFSLIYYFRPGDIIPGVAQLHLAKVAAILAILGLLLGSKRIAPRGLPLEIKIVFGMFAWMVLTIPFAWWRGGAADVVLFEFSKAVITMLALVLTVSRLVELRRLMLVQALGVALMTVAAVIVNNRMQGRLAGIGDAMLANPNDLAINVALNWPICLVFLLTSKGVLKKVLWAVSMLIMIYAVMATYSRAGFMALILAILVCLWDFGIRGRRAYLLGIALLCLVGAVAVAPGNYVKRLETLVGKFQEGDLDRGSAEARKELLIESVLITAQHPLFGIGAGNFPAYTRSWRVTHNTYTQLSCECGIPVLLLFLFLMWRAFLNLRALRKLPRTPQTEEMRLYTNALTAAFAAYALGAFFGSTAYELFPYFMVVYTTLLYRLSFQGQDMKAMLPAKKSVLYRSRSYSPVG